MTQYQYHYESYFLMQLEQHQVGEETDLDTKPKYNLKKFFRHVSVLQNSLMPSLSPGTFAAKSLLLKSKKK